MQRPLANQVEQNAADRRRRRLLRPSVRHTRGVTGSETTWHYWGLHCTAEFIWKQKKHQSWSNLRERRLADNYYMMLIVNKGLRHNFKAKDLHQSYRLNAPTFSLCFWRATGPGYEKFQTIVCSLTCSKSLMAKTWTTAEPNTDCLNLAIL